MQLDRVVIHNFRSIKDATIAFDQHCRILLGKNEAGKSNVLKAIAAVFGEYEVSAKDRRKKIDNERIDSYYVAAYIRLNDKDKEDIANDFLTANEDPFGMEDGILNLIHLVFKEFYIKVPINDDAFSSYNHSSSDYSKFKVLDGSITVDEIIDKLFNIVISKYEEAPLICHFWEYSDTFLLPSSISIPSFIAKPSSCKVLQNLFILCDRENIKNEFDAALAEDGDYLNLLDQVSQKTTKVFRKIWPDFKDTSIDLIPNGGEISIKVQNKARYSFDDRSDGFKHFVSILLMLSAPSQKGHIGNKDIILIDEPDSSLYPSSARYLRDELLRMSNSSYIVYATHSQYMIDSTCIDRHIIVEKKNDVTSLNNPNTKAEFSEDELLLNAIGTSIFECIHNNNIVFEGWIDKQLFEKVLLWDKGLKNSFVDYGRVYLHGISGVMTLCQLLMLAGKSFCIVADSDETSNNKKKDFIKAYPEYKDCWVDYASYNKQIYTVEDFFKEEYIERIIKDKYDNTFKYNQRKHAIDNICQSISDKEVIKRIKIDLISNARETDVKLEDYKSYLNCLLPN